MRKTLSTLVLCFSLNAFAQIPVATQTLLDGVKSSESKNVIKSVLRIECPKDGVKGTGFVVAGVGIVVTNAHVTSNCGATELAGVSPVSSEPVKFSSMVKDDNRDLALLCPIHAPPFSLKLSGDEKPLVETEVETWGYPLRYNRAAPILSRGYLAGYDEGLNAQGQLKNPLVEHLVVNGAFNPGNSGGPLIDRATGKVIGIVVEKWGLYSPFVEQAIAGLQHATAVSSSGLSYIDPATGKRITLMNEQVTALALQEIYNASQVMMGEAISVSELNAFIKEKKKDLACNSK
jgi:hypothetical protein